MAWNEPGGNNKDPWGSRGNQGPPDLDEVVRKMQNKLGGLFGGGKGGAGSKKGGPSFAALGLILLLGAIVWLFTGIYIVDAGKQGVVLRFGEYTKATQPGPHWHIPYPIEQVEIVDVEQRRFVEIGYRSAGGGQNAVVVPREALMLTQDENIVNIQLAVQYQVSDPREFLFNVRDPELVLKQVAESAIREVVGRSEMDFILKEGRAEVVSSTKTVMQAILDEFKSGLLVSDVNLQDAQPPDDVQAAFSDAIKAREDKERLKNEAEAYANDIVPKARGAAARQIQEAEAYKAAVTAKSEGEANRFEALLVEYKKAPLVTRKRLYLDTIESVMSSSSKVLVDTDSGSSLMYLPIDKLLENAASTRASTKSMDSAPSSVRRQTGSQGGPRSSRSTREPR